MKSVYIAAVLLALVGPVFCIDARLTKIKGRYIVVLNDDVTLESLVDRIQLDMVSGSEKFTVFRKYYSALNGFAAEMSDAVADMVRMMPEVKYVEEDAIGIVDVGATSWGLDRIDQEDLPLDNRFDIQGDGEGVTVYILDTGVRGTHKEFGGRVTHGGDFVGDGWNGIDCHGHGTHCAGTAAGGIRGIARKADIVSVRLFNCRGSGTLSGAIAGVEEVIRTARYPAVMSMSFGFFFSPSLDDAVARAVENGIVAVTSAGNNNFYSCFFSPAREPTCITVGATNRNDERASFSNYGRCVDIFAPGVDITSASPASDTATAIWSGTSMSAPHVAGAAAVLLGNGVPASEIFQRLLRDSAPNKIYNTEYRSPNRLLYLR